MKELLAMVYEFVKKLFKGVTILSAAPLVGGVLVFVWNEIRPGELTPVLGGAVGVYLEPDSTLQLVVPLSIVNTGARRVVRHVTNADADVMTASGEQFVFHWWLSLRLVSTEEYNQLHPGHADPAVVDVPVYDSRAFPFSIPGDSAVSKVFSLKTADNRKATRQELEDFLKNFVLTLNIHRVGGSRTITAAYRCQRQPVSSRLRWCMIVAGPAPGAPPTMGP